MPIKLKIILFLLIGLFILFIYRRAARNKISAENIIPWLVISVLMLLVIVFDSQVKTISNLIGIQEASNFVFFLCLGLVIAKLFILSATINKQKSQIIKLTQQLSILQSQNYKKCVNKDNKHD